MYSILFVLVGCVCSHTRAGLDDDTHSSPDRIKVQDVEELKPEGTNGDTIMETVPKSLLLFASYISHEATWICAKTETDLLHSILKHLTTEPQVILDK